MLVLQLSYIVFVVVVFINLIVEERPKTVKRYVGDITLSLVSILIMGMFIVSKIFESLSLIHLSLLVDKYMAKFAGYFYIT